MKCCARGVLGIPAPEPVHGGAAGLPVPPAGLGLQGPLRPSRRCGVLGYSEGAVPQSSGERSGEGASSPFKDTQFAGGALRR